MELQSLENLERQINHLLERFNGLRGERDELSKNVGGLEAELAEQRRANQMLEDELNESRRNARDPQNEALIKAKVEELLAKLEGI